MGKRAFQQPTSHQRAILFVMSNGLELASRVAAAQIVDLAASLVSVSLPTRPDCRGQGQQQGCADRGSDHVRQLHGQVCRPLAICNAHGIKQSFLTAS
jgi:hypothetical protein